VAATADAESDSRRYVRRTGRIPRSEQLPDAGVYHARMRGVDGCAIYRDDTDRFRFMSFLRLATKRAQWQVLAYCLMLNHFHLVVAAELELLSRGMHTLAFRYAQAFNRRHDRYGGLYADRFGASYVEGDDYLENVCAYVYENADRVGVHDWPWRGGELIGGAASSDLDGSERRRPRADRRRLAAAAVQPAVAERVLGLHHLVDLCGAFVDDRRARVAEVPLDPVLRRVAVRPEHLDREVRRLERRLRRVPLRQ
jgi:hypothetical protein